MCGHVTMKHMVIPFQVAEFRNISVESTSDFYRIILTMYDMKRTFILYLNVYCEKGNTKKRGTTVKV